MMWAGGQYTDYFPAVYGIEKLDGFVTDNKVQEAYVELNDATLEKSVIEALLQNSIVVHKGLGDSKLNYQEQIIEEVNGNSVITVTTSEIAFSKRIELLGRRLWKKSKIK